MNEFEDLDSDAENFKALIVSLLVRYLNRCCSVVGKVLGLLLTEGQCKRKVKNDFFLI